MKKLLYTLLVAIFGVFSIITSCKKDKPDPDPAPCTTCQKVTEAKDYFAFKLGSWWVYEEETSLERDSVYVTQSNISNGYDFDTYVFSNYQNYYYHFIPQYIENLSGCSVSSPVNKKCLFVIREKFKSGDYIGYGDCFFINYKEGDYDNVFNVAFPNNKIIVESILSSYNLGSFIFDKTIKIKELNTFIEGKQPTNHYFSKDVGLIRKELIDSNQIWNLVNYHIEP